MQRKSVLFLYKNTILLVLSLGVFIFLASVLPVRQYLDHLHRLGYLGALIAGMFAVSTFTVVPSFYVLFVLAGTHNPFLISIAGGVGGVIGDLILLRFFQDGVFHELMPLIRKIKNVPPFKHMKAPYMKWVTPLIGAIIVASPFPDEIGIGMMGLSSISKWQFILLTFVLDTLGIMAIVFWAQP